MPIDALGWMQYNANHSICFCYWKWLATRLAILNNLLPYEHKNKNCYNIRCATRAHNVTMPYALRCTIRIHCHCSSQSMHTHTHVWLPVEPIHFDYLLSSSFLLFCLLTVQSFYRDLITSWLLPLITSISRGTEMILLFQNETEWKWESQRERVRWVCVGAAFVSVLPKLYEWGNTFNHQYPMHFHLDNTDTIHK